MKNEIVKATFKEYNELAIIAWLAESYLNTNNELTKKRLTEYIEEHKKTINI